MAVPMKTTNGNRKLILDVDTGIDDALALAYLANGNMAKAEQYATAADARTKAMIAAAQGNYSPAASTLTG